MVLQSLIVTLTSEMSRAKSGDERLAVISSNLNDAAIMLAAINGFAVVTAAWWLPLVFGEQYRSVLDITTPMLLAGTLKGLRLVIDRALRAMRQTVYCMIAEAIAFAGICCFGFAGAQWAGLKGFVWGVALAQLCGLATLTLGAARQLGVRWPELLPLRDLSHSRLLNLLARVR